MAGLGRRTFNAGEVLTAANVQGYLQDQAVMVFTNASTRNAAITAPSEGMVTYRADQDVVEFYTGAIWKSVSDQVVNYARNTTASLSLSTTTETELFRSSSWTPISGRLYQVTITIGAIQKTVGAGNITIRMRKDSTSGTILDEVLYSAQPSGSIWPHSKTLLLTSDQMGTSAFTPVITVHTNTNGAAATNGAASSGCIIFEDIGAS